MTNLTQLTTRFARRPLLLEPSAANALVRHLAAGDPRGMRSESRLDAVLRKIGLGRAQPVAMHDDVDAEPIDTSPSCYSPLWAEQRYGDPSDTGFGWSLIQGVAMMEVATALSDRGEFFCGTFYHGYDTLMAAMREASADERVKGLFIRMMCPGGPVAGGLPELAEFMRTIRASAGGKPIHIFADMACSAAYWVASSADFISAPRVGLVGSIGAVIVHEDWSESLSRDGIKITPIQFGAKKTDGAWWASLSETALADLQAEIDQCGRDFVADVTLGRPKLTSEALIGTQAAVFMGHHDDDTRSGLALGFVDAIESEQAAFDRLLGVIETNATATTPQILKSNGPSAQTPEKESVAMAVPGKNKPKAQIQKKAETETVDAAGGAEAEAADGEGDCPTCAGTGEVDGETCAECGGTGKMTAEEAEADTPADDVPAEASSHTNAKAIASSPEGKANPGAALAAINAGLTLDQFRTMSAVTPAGARAPSALARAMAHDQPVGPDANAPKTSLGATLIAQARAMGQPSK